MLRLQRNLKNSRRAAFSLAELVISIGVLILMMALAGQVFTITIKSTGQATGLTEVTQQLRVLEETLREDLRNVHPGQSVMVIQGNPVNAFWTQLGKDAAFDQADPSKGYGHARDLEREKLRADGTPESANGHEIMQEPRADILMFFTARKATSTVDPRVSSRVQQVTYGHAEMGEYQPVAATPGTYQMVPDIMVSPGQGIFPVDSGTFYPTPTTPSRVPANQWHLARRSVLVLPVAAPPPAPAPPLVFGAPQLLTGEDDVLWGVDFERQVLRSQVNGAGVPDGYPWYLPAALVAPNQPIALRRNILDPTPPMMMANRMGAYFAPNCASFKVEWSLDPRSPFVAGRLDGTSEVFWIDPGDQGDAARPTYKSADPLYSIQKRIDELKNMSDAASRALKAQLDSLLCEQTLHADGSFYSLADRFRGVTCSVPGKPQSDPNYEWEQLAPDGERPNIAAFTATRPSGKCSQSSFTCVIDTDCPAGQFCIEQPAPDDIWPGALRITVDLYDRELRLDRPIRHVMVIPIGG